MSRDDSALPSANLEIRANAMLTRNHRLRRHHSFFLRAATAGFERVANDLLSQRDNILSFPPSPSFSPCFLWTLSDVSYLPYRHRGGTDYYGARALRRGVSGASHTIFNNSTPARVCVRDAGIAISINMPSITGIHLRLTVSTFCYALRFNGSHCVPRPYRSSSSSPAYSTSSQ